MISTEIFQRCYGPSKHEAMAQRQPNIGPALVILAYTYFPPRHSKYQTIPEDIHTYS